MKEKISNLFPAKRNAKTLPIAALVGMLAMSYPVTHAEESATPPNQAADTEGSGNTGSEEKPRADRELYPLPADWRKLVTGKPEDQGTLDYIGAQFEELYKDSILNEPGNPNWVKKYWPYESAYEYRAYEEARVAYQYECAQYVLNQDNVLEEAEAIKAGVDIRTTEYGSGQNGYYHRLIQNTTQFERYHDDKPTEGYEAARHNSITVAAKSDPNDPSIDNDVYFAFKYDSSTKTRKDGGTVAGISDVPYVAAKLQDKSGGAAIYNTIVTGDISIDFADNSVQQDNNSGNAKSALIRGGAIFLDGGEKRNKDGEKIEDTSADQVAAYSRATKYIRNIKGNFINNYAKSTKTDLDNYIDPSDEPGEDWNRPQDYWQKGAGVDGGAIHLNIGAIGYVISEDTEKYPSGIDEEIGKVGGITGDFVGNHVTTVNGRAWGGAIYNSSANSTASGASTKSYIGDIDGDFIANYAIANYRSARGGAIYMHHDGAKIGIITGDFIGNYALTKGEYRTWTTKETSGQPETGQDFGHAAGGAVYNGDKSIIEGIRGDFIGNYAENINDTLQQYGGALGGAIANTTEMGTTVNQGAMLAGGEIYYIIGDFKLNRAQADAGMARGGAILNSTRQKGSAGGIIDHILVNFTGNYTRSEQNLAEGGAIYNGKNFNRNPDMPARIGDIEGSFVKNYAWSGGDEEHGYFVDWDNSTVRQIHAAGGAIFNIYANIQNIKADFEGNYALSKHNTATGGAFHNQETSIENIYGSFTNNYALSTGSEKELEPVPEDPTGKKELSDDEIQERKELSRVYAAGGAIFNDRATIGDIEGDFAGNKAIAENATGGYGGAIFNAGGKVKLYEKTEDETADDPYIISGFEERKTFIGKIVGNFEGNEATTDGGAIYNTNNAEIDDIKGDFAGNLAHKGSGGAIYNSNRAVLGRLDGEFSENRAGADGGAVYNADNASIDNITGNFSGNFAKVDGGAIYNTDVVTIGDVEADFTDNTAEKGSGGAIYNYDDAYIGKLKGTYAGNSAMVDGGAIYNAKQVTIESIEGAFADNRAHTGSGGAIYNSESSPLLKLESEFTANTAALHGGAIYNEEAYIGELTINSKGGFANNRAGGSGGAIYNAQGGTMSGISAEFTGNTAASGGAAIHNVGTIGGEGKLHMQDVIDHHGEVKGQMVTSYENDSTTDWEPRQYDGTIADGIVNSSFVGNNVTGTDRAAAVYTETTLAFTARDEYRMVFEANTIAGNKDEQSDLWVAANPATGEMPRIYMIAEKNSSITTHGVVYGEGTFILRLRGYGDHTAELGHADAGLVDFENLVIHADVILDDVTLKLGLAHDTTKPEVSVYDDTLPPRQGGLTLDAPGVDVTGAGGEVPVVELKEKHGYSDVLRNSTLETRSGWVSVEDDGLLTNYNIGRIVANGNKSYDTGRGYYRADYPGTDSRPYTRWAIDIDLKKEQADTFTTWYSEGNESGGYITLSGCNILYTEGDVLPATDQNGYSKNPEDPAGFLDGSAYDRIDDYFDVTIQVINLIKTDAEGKEVDIPDAWKNEDLDINQGSPLQLDLGQLKKKDSATPYMSSDDILARGIGYGTTKTANDSIRIWGWRDNLAAWAELQESGTEDEVYGKVFTIMKEHTLSRNVQRRYSQPLQEHTLLQESSLKIVGTDRQSDTLNLNGKNLLAEVAAGQTLELNRIGIINAGTDDTRTEAEGTIYQTTRNRGTLIMDTVKVENELRVINDKDVYKRGNWGIANIFTSTQRDAGSALPERTYGGEDAVAGAAAEGIRNSLHLQEGKTFITGTIEYQNILNEAGATTYLLVHETADARGATEDADSFSKPEEATQAFKNFYGNSLTMADGVFYLSNLNSSELQLRKFVVENGSIEINSVSVDLSAHAAEGNMGRIWAYDETEAERYDAAQYSGHIVVAGKDGAGLQLMHRDDNVTKTTTDARHGEHYAVPVRFVNPEVAAAVIPFGNENDYYDDTRQLSNEYTKEGKNYVYTVDYDYTTGYYTYRRPVEAKPDDFTPDAVLGPVAQAAGAVASLMQLNDYVFEHADLFSANMYNAQKARLAERSFTIITPVKGDKNAAPQAAPKTTCSDKAGFKGGMWVRPYASYEKLPLSNGPKVTNSLYGALVGGDTAMTEHKSGWASVFSAHAAYLGSTQRYNGKVSSARISQNGGAVGITETLYYKNFYTALSATLGTSSGHANTSAGTENFHMLMGGVASRSGYNIELGKGRYVLQPTLLLSYTLVNTSDYTNASGARISADPLHTLQLHPYVKFIINTESCWQPYLTAGYVHNLMGNTRFRADNVCLPEMSIDPYVEYGAGIQKTWADTYTIFGQATGRNGGRNGIEFSTGLRWAW